MILQEEPATAAPEPKNSTVILLIDEWIHDERYRAILKDRLVRGLTYEQIAELHDMSVTHIKRIIYREQEKIFRHME